LGNTLLCRATHDRDEGLWIYLRAWKIDAVHFIISLKVSTSIECTLQSGKYFMKCTILYLVPDA